MNPTYRDLILANIRAAVDRAETVSGVDHEGLRGRLREIFAAELIRPLLPKDAGCATGKIIGHDGFQSTEQDVVVFDRGILPPILFEGQVGLIPLESAIYAIEVKSKLTAEELRTSHANALQFHNRSYLSGAYLPFATGSTSSPFPIVSAVFAFHTDLTVGGKTETERYIEICGSDPVGLSVICIAGHSYSWWEKGVGWHAVQPSYPFEETVTLIAGMMNTFGKAVFQRGKPNLGHYLI